MLCWRDTGKQTPRTRGSLEKRWGLDQGAVHGLAIDVCKGEGTYSGQFARNQRHGLGELRREDGTWFIGGWRAGNRSGAGFEGESELDITHDASPSKKDGQGDISQYASVGLQGE
eukprot:3820542-Rhodomonas_salina.2